MTSLRILSFNIHGGRSRDGQRDLGRVHDLMERCNIDIGVFQEMETRASFGGRAEDIEMLAGPTRLHRFFGPTMHEGKGWYGNLVVSRYPITHSLLHDLGTRAKHEPRGAIDVRCTTTLGSIRIIGTHLSLWPGERRTEARNLIRLMREVEEEEKAPLFLMGDINEWQRPSRLLLFLNKELIPIPCRASFPSFFPLLRLDRIWCDAPGLRVKAHRLATREVRKLSDHLPIVVSVEKVDGVCRNKDCA